jgi:DNA primase
LLIEEGFSVKVVTLEDGLDPDRYVRERGAQAYVAALRAARRHSEFLIDRARALFPPVSAQAKVKAMNFLLPHIQHIPDRIARDEFAADAAQKLSIDSALLRQELQQAARGRRAEVAPKAAAAPTWSEAEKDLLRALTQPVGAAARELARRTLAEEPVLYEGLAAAPILAVLAENESVLNPFDLAPDEASRHLLAAVLLPWSREIEPEDVQAAVDSLRHGRLEQRQRELRRLLSEAEARRDSITVGELMAEKIALDRALRESAASAKKSL